MSVIIRLQNLPWSANALDIRGFFHGLSIPDGGVHIVGGEMGDAFIAFSTDEDARQAMSMDRGKLNEVQVRLLLSSRAEMQKVIETARNKSLSMQMQRSQQQNPQITLPAPQPPVITSTTLKHIMSNQQNQLALNPMQQYQSYNQTLNMENSQDSRDSRSDNNGDNNKSRSRNRSKDRRSSSPSRNRDRRRSTSRGRDSRRRGRDRSRSRSRSRDHKNSGRRRRSRSRDRGNTERSRWDKDSRDRDSDRKDTEKETKKMIEKDMGMEKEVEQPPIPPPNSTKLNLWNPSAGVNPLFPPGANVMQGYTTISQNMNMQQQQIQTTPVYQTNISAGYQSANQFNQMFPQFNKPPPIDGSLNNQTDNLQQNKFQNMMNMNNPSQGNSLNFNNLNPNNNLGLQNTFNSTSFNATGTNSPQQSSNNQQQLSTDIMNSLGGGMIGNKLTSFSGIFSSQNKKVDDNNKPLNDPRIQNSSNNNMIMNKSNNNNNNNQNELQQQQQQNYGDINFDELRGNCIKISNMCPSTSYSDIRRFFSGLFIANNGIKMINDKHGLRIGVAYVRFVRPESKPKAFIRNGSPLKNKKILIESVTEDEFEEEIDSYKPVRRFDNNRFSNDDRPPPHIPLRGDLDNSSPHNDDTTSSNIDNKLQGPNQSSKTNISGVNESIAVDDDDDDDSDSKKDDQQKQSFTILKLDDVPVFAKEYDIMKMFSSYTIIDILLAKNEDNKRFLKCYVKFHLPEDAKAAIKNKSLHIIGHKQIYVNSCTEEKFNEVKEKLNQPEIIEESMDDDDNNINNNNESENQDNINDISYDPYNPNMKDNRYANSNDDNDNNNEFDNNAANDNNKNNNFINNMNNTNNNNNNRNNNNQPPSLLNLPPLGRLDTNLDPRRRDNKPSRFNNSSDNKIMNNNMNRFVLLRNCEYKLNKRDFAEFFTTINLTPERIEIIRNNRNQPCGECIIEFQNDIEAKKAFSKNNTLLAGRTCRMETIPVNIAADKLGDDSIRIGNDNNNGFMLNNNNNMFPGGGNNNNNMYPNQQNDNFRNNTFRQNRGDDGPRGLDNFDNRNNNNNMGNNNRSTRFSDNNGSNNDSGRMMMGGGGNNNNNNFNMNMRRDINNMPPINNASIDQFGQPGSVVGLKNVPYKAVTEDILDFFGNFKLGPQNVIRRYNDDGAPTGDARVAFNSPMEARAACEQMRNCKIFNRQVYLSIV